MMTSHLIKNSLVALLLVITAAQAQAQEPAPGAPTPPAASGAAHAIHAARATPRSTAQATPAPPPQRGKNLVFLQPVDIGFITRGLRPPAVGSAADHNDVQEVLAIQQRRTEQDCARALSERIVSLETFFGRPAGLFSQAELQIVEPLFESIAHDADEMAAILKDRNKRTRPYARGKGAIPCPSDGPMFVNPERSFPSGHSAIAYAEGLVLSELFPGRKAAIMKRAEEIGQDRIIFGVHHPSDVQAGFEVARRTIQAMKSRPAFNEALRKVRQQLGEQIGQQPHGPLPTPRQTTPLTGTLY